MATWKAISKVVACEQAFSIDCVIFDECLTNDTDCEIYKCGYVLANDVFDWNFSGDLMLSGIVEIRCINNVVSKSKVMFTYTKAMFSQWLKFNPSS